MLPLMGARGHRHDSSTLISTSNEESDSESDGALRCHGSVEVK